MIPSKTVSTSANGNVIISTNGIKNLQNSFKIIKNTPSDRLSHFYVSDQSSNTHVSYIRYTLISYIFVIYTFPIFPNLSRRAREITSVFSPLFIAYTYKGYTCNNNEKKTRINTLKKKNSKEVVRRQKISNKNPPTRIVH